MYKNLNGKIGPDKKEVKAMYSLVIVDDEREIRKGFCNYFPWSEIGFKIVADYESAQEADEYLREHPVDVLVTDIRMQGMSGLELIESLRKRQDKTKVVVISGYRDFEYARQAMKLGVRHYLVKPVKFSQISEVFGEICKELDMERAQQKEAEAPAENVDAHPADGQPNEIIRRVKSYVHKHYEDATLESAAKSVKMNPYYLSSYFHQQTNEKFSDYLIRVRMREAARLLTRTSMQIQEVAQRVGYTTANSFSRSFRQYYNVTPKEYRLHNDGDETS